MSWFSWNLALKLVHICCVLVLISGLLGRFLVRMRLPTTRSLESLQDLMLLVDRFDGWLVVRGSQATLVTGLLLGWVGGWPYLTAGRPTWIFVSLLLFLSTVPLVIFVFVPRGRAFGKVFQAAIAEQRITPELRSALADPAVRAATAYESVAIGLTLGLMVFKPF